MSRWGLACAVSVMLTACSGAGTEPKSNGPGPGFAVAGSLASNFDVHLYRFEGDVVVQFHPNGGVAKIEVPGGADGEVCEVDVGFNDTDRQPRDCVALRDGKATVDYHNESSVHVALMLRTGRVEEAILTYTPGDNFLAVDFP